MEVDKLEELYSKLEKIPNLNDILIKKEDHVFRYKSEDGECTAVSIKSCPDVAIIESVMTAGCKLDIHEHEEGYEILIIIDGGISVNYQDGRTIDVGKWGYTVIERNVAHQVTSVKEKDTKLIGITVPKDAGYP
jgi:quercetin dioxygenase-like cupin family protein